MKFSYKVLIILFTLNAFVQNSFANKLGNQSIDSDNKEEFVLPGEITISGLVLDAGGMPIPGVSVYIKGTTIGVTTNFDGVYTLKVPENGAVLVFSFIGMTTKEVEVKDQKVIDIILEEKSLGLEEVVVTALGIKREKKALGYSVQEIGGEELSETKEMDLVNSLSGKVAGVNITQGGGGIGGGGSRIVIRGETSIAGNNTPLFVIDGIPGGSNDVSPDDVESVSVLKGPAAAALYGSRAAAGVVLITTKRGAEGATSVEINSNTSFQTPFILPDYQNKFGQGTGGKYKYYDGNNGVWPDGSISNDDYDINWGPAFDGNPRPQFTGNDPWVAYPDNVKNFYNTGYILNNNIAVSGGNKSGNYRLSYTNVRQKGIIPNTGLFTHKIDMNGGWNINEKLKISSIIKYSIFQSDNNNGYDPRLIPRNIDFDALKEYWVPGLEGIQQKKWRNSSNNPYFEVFENNSKHFAERFVGNTVLNYKINSYLSAMGRIGYVSHHDNGQKNTAFSNGNGNARFGYFEIGMGRSYELNTDFLITFEKDLSKDFNLKASGGGNHLRAEGASVSGKVDQLLIPDVYNLGNRRVYPKTGNGFSERELNSLYAFANLSWKNMVYMDVTARNDWSSTLPVENNSYFYPSFTLSGLVDKMFVLPEQISFWKLRANIAKVGSDTGPYQLQDAYYFTDGEGGRANIVQGGVKANANLKPELTTAWEAGTDIRFFNNRLYFDVTYYNSVTSNQILNVEVSPTTGYQFFLKNAGRIRNYGWELMANAEPIKTNDFSWNLTLNWARDRAIVEEYDPENPDAFLSRSVTTHLFVEDKEGERRGALYGKSFARAPNGEILYTKSGDTQRSVKEYIGNYNPDWMGSLQNEFKYKDFSFSFLLDLRYGGVYYSTTNYNLNIRGLSKATLLGGEDPSGNYVERDYILPDGMYLDGDVYRKLTRQDLIESGLSSGGLSGQQYWENIMDKEVPEAVMYDATYLKLRELRLSYKLPKRVLAKSFIEDAGVSLVVRNVAVWTKIPNVDPETFAGTEAGALPGVDFGAVPSVRNISFNVNLKF